MFLLYRIIFHCISLYQNQNYNFIKDSRDDFTYWDWITVVQWCVAGLGVLFIWMVSYLFIITTHIVYLESKENLYLYLDGNGPVFDNFHNVTLTRGILKMDVIGNLNFVLALGFFNIIDERTADWRLWVTIGLLFVVLVVADAMGA